MAGKKTTLENVPSKDVGKVVQGYVLVRATNITCTKQSPDELWTIEATIPDRTVLG